MRRYNRCFRLYPSADLDRWLAVQTNHFFKGSPTPMNDLNPNKSSKSEAALAALQKVVTWLVVLLFGILALVFLGVAVSVAVYSERELRMGDAMFALSFLQFGIALIVSAYLTLRGCSGDSIIKPIIFAMGILLITLLFSWRAAVMLIALYSAGWIAAAFAKPRMT